MFDDLSFWDAVVLAGVFSAGYFLRGNVRWSSDDLEPPPTSYANDKFISIKRPPQPEQPFPITNRDFVAWPIKLLLVMLVVGLF